MLSVLTEGPIVNELPMSPLGYALLALGGFAALLAVTFAFRSVGTKHQGPRRPGVGGH